MMVRMLGHLLMVAATIVSLAACVATVEPPLEQSYPTDLQLRIPDRDDEIIEAKRITPLRPVRPA